jgi:multiple sugar transport system substrate-binding protein
LNRFSAVFISAVLAASTLAGCSASNPAGSGSTKEVTITFAMGKDTSPATAKQLDEFQKKYTNIKVKFIEMPDSSDAQHDDYVTKLSGGDTSVDVFALDIIWPPEFGAAKWTLPLDDYFPKAEQDKFLAGPLAGSKWDGKLYAIPFFTDAGLFYYRKDILEKAGKQPPKTWAEVVSLSKELVGKDGIDVGVVFQGAQYEGLVCDILEVMRGNGGDVLDGKKVVVNSPNNIEAINIMKSLLDQKVAPEGVTTYKENESLQSFLEGKALFMRNWPYAWAAAQSDPASKIKDKVGVVSVPMGPKGSKPSATLGGWNLAINGNIPQERKDAAITFLKWMTGDEAQKIKALLGGNLPTRKAIYEDADVLKANPHWKDFYSVFINAAPRPVTPVYPKISDAMQINIHKAITGQITAEVAVKNMQDAIEQITK